MKGNPVGLADLLSAIDHLSETIVVTERNDDGENVIAYVNPAFERMTGYTAEEAIGRNPRFLQGKDTSELERRRIRKAIDAHKPIVARVVNYKKTGEPYSVELTIAPVIAAGGKVTHFLSLQRDVSRISKLEDETRRKARLFEDTADGSLTSIFLLEPVMDGSAVVDFRFTYVNRRGAELVGRKRSDIVGQNLCELIPINREQGFIDKYIKVYQTGEALEEEFSIDTSDINARWLAHQVVRTPSGIAINTNDITERKQKEIMLDARERTVRAFLEHTPGLAWIVSESGKIIDHNAAFEAAFKPGLRGRNVREFLSPQEAEIYLANNHAVIRSGEPMETIEPGVDAFGQESTYQVFKFPLGEIDGEPATGGIAFQINRARGILNLDQLVNELIDNSRDGLMLLDDQGTIVEWNSAAERILGYTRKEAVGRALQEFLVPESKLIELRLILKEARTGKATSGLRTLRRHRNGDMIPVEITLRPMHNEKGEVIAIADYFQDISEQIHDENRLTSLALEDPLTGLPNRAALIERLASPGSWTGDWYGLAIVGLGQLTDLRDVFGQGEFNSAVVQTAEHIAPRLPSSAYFARIAEEEFAVLFSGRSRDEVLRAVERLRAQIEEPFQRNFMKAGFDTRIGLYVFQPDDLDADVILNRAHTAYADARLGELRHINIYDLQMTAMIERRLHIQDLLNGALARNEFRLVLQPIVTNDGRVHGAEVLLRWTPSSGEQISPVEFIPILEKTGGIIEVGEFVIESALHVAKQIEERVGILPHFSVNISAQQVRHSTFVDQVDKALAMTGARAESLVFEITETQLMENHETSVKVLENIRKLGASWAIDDFGTGYSSLAYLRDLPVDTIKIDRAFVSRIDIEPERKRMLELIVSLGKSLDHDLIAEGVETEGEQQALASMGVNLYQGYLFSKPLEIDAFFEFCEGRNLAGKSLEDRAG